MTVTRTGAVAVTLIVQDRVGDLLVAMALFVPKSNPVTMVLPTLVAAATPTVQGPGLLRSVATQSCARRSKFVTTATRMLAVHAIRIAPP